MSHGIFMASPCKLKRDHMLVSVYGDHLCGALICRILSNYNGTMNRSDASKEAARQAADEWERKYGRVSDVGQMLTSEVEVSISETWSAQPGSAGDT